MIEEYYSRLAVLNKNPEILKNKSDEQKTKLKTALNNISSKMESTDEDLEQAITEFIKVFDVLGLDESATYKSRGLAFRKGTNLPRQLINDVTIMTLKSF